MIEHFMLTANEAVATLLFEREIPCVYRIHEPPASDKLAEVLSLSSNLGLDIRGIDAEKPTSKRLADLILSAEEQGVSAPVSYAMLRSMSKAKYSDMRSAHFGLGLSTYCHFTSPIRRLSDLATHRIINNVLLDGKRAQNYTSYARRAAVAATDAELRALSAERRIENLYKVLYMSEHVGEYFDASVSSVTSFGMFCETDNTCEGLVPISEMPGEFMFDEKNLAMRSRDKVYRLAERVRVCLEEVDVIRGKMRFSIAEDEE
jgi:ribonuclease R